MPGRRAKSSAGKGHISRMEDELTQAQIEELRADLLALKEELEAALRGTRESAKTVELDQQSVGRLSRMDAMQQQAMAKANQSAQETRLQQVQAALRWVESGEYGLCRSCEDDIGYRRLKARPETPMCLNCQRERESR